MSDELKTIEGDASKVIADAKADAAKLGAVEAKASGWTKNHIVWLIGLGCLLAGTVMGYLAHR